MPLFANAVAYSAWESGVQDCDMAQPLREEDGGDVPRCMPLDVHGMLRVAKTRRIASVSSPRTRHAMSLQAKMRFVWQPLPGGMLDSDAGTTTEHAEVLPTVACGEDTLLPPPLPGTLKA